MKNKWNIWFLLSATSALLAVLDLISRRNGQVVGLRLAGMVLYAGLGLLQPFCLSRGPRGRKLFYGIAAAAVALLVLLLVLGLRKP